MWVSRIERYGGALSRDGGVLVLRDIEKVPSKVLQSLTLNKGEALEELRERERDFPYAASRLVEKLEGKGVRFTLTDAGQSFRARGPLAAADRELLRRHRDAALAFLETRTERETWRTPELVTNVREQGEVLPWPRVLEIYGKASTPERQTFEALSAYLMGMDFSYWIAFGVAALRLVQARERADERRAAA